MESYIQQLEIIWTTKATEETQLRGRLKVVQKPMIAGEPPPHAPLCDVLHIDEQGKARRIGGFSYAGDFELLSTAARIENLGPEGITVYRDQGFRALVQLAHKPAATTLDSQFKPGKIG